MKPRPFKRSADARGASEGKNTRISGNFPRRRISSGGFTHAENGHQAAISDPMRPVSGYGREIRSGSVRHRANLFSF